MVTSIGALRLAVLVTLAAAHCSAQLITCYTCNSTGSTSNVSCAVMGGSNNTGFGFCSGQVCTLSSVTDVNGVTTVTRGCGNFTANQSSCAAGTPGNPTACLCLTNLCNGAFGFCDNCTGATLVPPSGPTIAPGTVPAPTTGPASGVPAPVGPVGPTVVGGTTTAPGGAGMGTSGATPGGGMSGITCVMCNSNSTVGCLTANSTSLATCDGAGCYVQSDSMGNVVRGCKSSPTNSSCSVYAKNVTTCTCNSTDLCNIMGLDCDANCNGLLGSGYAYQYGSVKCVQCGVSGAPSCEAVDGAYLYNGTMVSTCSGLSCVNIVSGSMNNVLTRDCAKDKLADFVAYNPYDIITCTCNDDFCNQIGLQCGLLISNSAHFLSFQPIAALLTIITLVSTTLIG